MPLIMECQSYNSINFIYHLKTINGNLFRLWLLISFIFFYPGIIYLRSHLGKYLSVDSFGNVLCETDERDAGSRFQISIADDNSGRWALKNESRGYFLGGNPEKLTCTAKAPGKGEFWTVHLAARPQVLYINILL